jgi:two-component system, sensor histidine kinase
MFEAARSASQGGIKSDIGTDGVERIIAFTPVRLDPESDPYMYIFVGSPKAIVHANAQKGMVRDMLLFFLTLALALGLGWGVGGRSLKRKLEELAMISKQIGEGDFSVRIAEDSDVNEVLAFSKAFNRMTKALEEDLSERKRVEDALRESEARFRNLFDLIPAVAVQGYSMDGTTRFWNKASEFFYGYSTDEALGKNMVDLIIPEEMRPIVVQEMNAMAKTGKPIPPSELYLKRKDGSCIQVFSSHAVIERHNQPPEFFCIDIDLTQLKQTEEALIKAKQAAEASNRAKSEFLANMSHEIRTPLNGITGMLQVLKTTGLQGEQVEFTDTALQSCRRLTTLLTDILDLSRIEAGKMAIVAAPLRLSDIVTQLQDLFSPSIKESGVALNFHIAPDIPAQLIGDATRLQQVLTNLLGNALKFTSVGSVTVEAYPLPPRRTGEYRVLFCVADTGIGIPDDKLSELFRPFAQVCEGFRRQYQGAGLGLSICKRLVDLMGGTMAVESELDVGTAIYFCIPFCLESAVAELQSETKVSVHGSLVPALAGLRVLIAEDDRVSGNLASILLANAGATAKVVEDGEQALAALRQEHFDIVLMDIQMPVMGGVDATKAIRNGEAGKDKKDIPIIALTAYAMAGDREKFLAAGMNGYLAKPVEVEALLKVIEEAMHRAKGRA